ncbi:MAG: hypothetical protein HQ575_06170 [Candidatus Omnitrophica bacterium]|nr:hypothetical protein [Candidatus Omnitrophota bacterium]
MKKLLCLLISVIFLSGCALTTIKPYKKGVVKKPKPVTQRVAEKIKEVLAPMLEPEPEVVVEEKEEILSPRQETEAKEEILQEEEDIK